MLLRDSPDTAPRSNDTLGVRHHEVRDHHVERLGVHKRHGVSAVRTLHDTVAGGLKRPSHEPPAHRR